MGFLQRVSSISAPARIKASGLQDYSNAFWSGAPMEWIGALSSAGVTVTPELALTLSAMYSGVTMIGRDLATLPAQALKLRADGGKDKVQPFHGQGIDTSGGIRSLAYMLRWQPNPAQTASEFWLGQVAQYLLRGRAYAEIRSGPTGFMEALLPRHPDRVTPERLPSGRMRYKLMEANGQPRYVTQEEMHVVSDLSLDGGLTVLGRVQFGAQSLGSALATQSAAGKFFKSGMTAAKIATYEGEMEPEDEAALHASISRFATGVDNSFGLALIPDKVTISNLGVDPDKAMMMESQEWGVREVARLLNLPQSKLGIKDSVSYANQVQAALDYIISCLRPIAVTFEQAIQRDLILAKDAYVVEFKLEGLMRGDFDSQSSYLEKFIRSRVMRPSEARLILNMNPDAELDRLSESDFKPGTSGVPQPRQEQPPAQNSRAQLRAFLAVHDNAVRCLRREKAAIAKLATKHASDPAGWQTGLRDFLAEHAGFVARTMRLPIDTARGVCAQHGTALEAQGMPFWTDDFERCEADELAALALDGERAA